MSKSNDVGAILRAKITLNGVKEIKSVAYDPIEKLIATTDGNSVQLWKFSNSKIQLQRSYLPENNVRLLKILCMQSANVFVLLYLKQNNSLCHRTLLYDMKTVYDMGVISEEFTNNNKTLPTSILEARQEILIADCSNGGIGIFSFRKIVAKKATGDVIKYRCPLRQRTSSDKKSSKKFYVAVTHNGSDRIFGATKTVVTVLNAVTGTRLYEIKKVFRRPVIQLEYCDNNNLLVSCEGERNVTVLGTAKGGAVASTIASSNGALAVQLMQQFKCKDTTRLISIQSNNYLSINLLLQGDNSLIGSFDLSAHFDDDNHHAPFVITTDDEATNSVCLIRNDTVLILELLSMESGSHYFTAESSNLQILEQVRFNSPMAVPLGKGQWIPPNVDCGYLYKLQDPLRIYLSHDTKVESYFTPSALAKTQVNQVTALHYSTCMQCVLLGWSNGLIEVFRPYQSERIRVITSTSTTTTGGDAVSAICTVAVEKKGYVITAGFESGQIKTTLVTSHSHKDLQSLPSAHTNSIVSLLSNDISRLISVAANREVKVWSVDSIHHKMIVSGYVVVGGKHDVSAAAMLGNKAIVLGFTSGTIQQWKLPEKTNTRSRGSIESTRVCDAECKAYHSASITGISVSKVHPARSNAFLFATCAKDHSIVLWYSNQTTLLAFKKLELSGPAVNIFFVNELPCDSVIVPALDKDYSMELAVTLGPSVYVIDTVPVLFESSYKDLHQKYFTASSFTEEELPSSPSSSSVEPTTKVIQEETPLEKDLAIESPPVKEEVPMTAPPLLPLDEDDNEADLQCSVSTLEVLESYISEPQSIMTEEEDSGSGMKLDQKWHNFESLDKEYTLRASVKKPVTPQPKVLRSSSSVLPTLSSKQTAPAIVNMHVLSSNARDTEEQQQQVDSEQRNLSPPLKDAQSKVAIVSMTSAKSGDKEVLYLGVGSAKQKETKAAVKARASSSSKLIIPRSALYRKWNSLSEAEQELELKCSTKCQVVLKAAQKAHVPVPEADTYHSLEASHKRIWTKYSKWFAERDVRLDFLENEVKFVASNPFVIEEELQQTKGQLTLPRNSLSVSSEEELQCWNRFTWWYSTGVVVTDMTEIPQAEISPSYRSQMRQSFLKTRLEEVLHTEASFAKLQRRELARLNSAAAAAAKMVAKLQRTAVKKPLKQKLPSELQHLSIDIFKPIILPSGLEVDLMPYGDMDEEQQECEVILALEDYRVKAKALKNGAETMTSFFGIGTPKMCHIPVSFIEWWSKPRNLTRQAFLLREARNAAADSKVKAEAEWTGLVLAVTGVITTSVRVEGGSVTDVDTKWDEFHHWYFHGKKDRLEFQKRQIEELNRVARTELVLDHGFLNDLIFIDLLPDPICPGDELDGEKVRYYTFDSTLYSVDDISKWFSAAELEEDDILLRNAQENFVPATYDQRESSEEEAEDSLIEQEQEVSSSSEESSEEDQPDDDDNDDLGADVSVTRRKQYANIDLASGFSSPLFVKPVTIQNLTQNSRWSEGTGLDNGDEEVDEQERIEQEKLKQLELDRIEAERLLNEEKKLEQEALQVELDKEEEVLQKQREIEAVRILEWEANLRQQRKIAKEKRAEAESTLKMHAEDVAGITLRNMMVQNRRGMELEAATSQIQEDFYRDECRRMQADRDREQKEMTHEHDISSQVELHLRQVEEEQNHRSEFLQKVFEPFDPYFDPTDGVSDKNFETEMLARAHARKNQLVEEIKRKQGRIPRYTMPFTKSILLESPSAEIYASEPSRKFKAMMGLPINYTNTRPITPMEKVERSVETLQQSRSGIISRTRNSTTTSSSHAALMAQINRSLKKPISVAPLTRETPETKSSETLLPPPFYKKNVGGIRGQVGKIHSFASKHPIKRLKMNRYAYRMPPVNDSKLPAGFTSGVISLTITNNTNQEDRGDTTSPPKWP